VHFHRIAEPLRVVSEAGHTAFTGPVLDDKILSTVDTVLAHMIHADEDSEAWLNLAALGSHRLVLDVDDAMWAPDWGVFQDYWTPARLKSLYRNVGVAHVITTPSPRIAAHLAQFNPNVWVVPNTVPAWALNIERAERDWPAVGYQGSPSHGADWTQADQRAIERWLQDRPDWHLSLHGSHAGKLDGHPRVHAFGWTSDHRVHYQQLADNVDIGIGPLLDTEFNRCKSSLRHIEYAALGIVSLLPEVQPYHQSSPGGLVPYFTGWLTSGDLYGDLMQATGYGPTALASVGRNARNWAAEHTTETQITKWTQAWMSV